MPVGNGPLRHTVQTFDYSVPLDLGVLAPMRHSLSDWLESEGVTDPPRADMVLAAHEGTANAIQHSKTSRPIEIHASVGDGRVTVEIRDHGSWKVGTDASEERGRGLGLMAKLVAGMELQKSHAGTTLRLRETY